MGDIDIYLKTLLFANVQDLGIPGARYKIDEISSKLLNVVSKVVAQYNVDDIVDTISFTVDMCQELIEATVFLVEKEQFAGTYYVYIPSRYLKYRDKMLAESKIYASSQRIGARYFADVFSGYREDIGDRREMPSQNVIAIPASNRIVSLQHNQVQALEGETTKVIEAVAAQNQIEASPGLRELIVGQLKAGRELIRAGEFRLYLLQLSLVEPLKWLADKYAKEAIGDLALRLLKVLAEHLGIDI